MITETQCDRCRHLRHLPDGRSLMTCAAYPGGIPSTILKGDVATRRPPADHRQPFEGDHGVRFEPLPGARHPLDVVGV